jgi:RNA polymerase sigma-70 factor, ECF subfamily
MGYRSVSIFQTSKLLEAALDGDTEAVGQLLDHFRAYLIVIAHRQLDDRLRGRMDPMDVVQTTFLEAHQDFSKFQGKEINTFLSWLRNILHNNIETAHQKHLSARKRSAKLETSGKTQLGDNEVGSLIDILPSESSSPSQRVMRDEVAASLAECLLKLPETQAEAIRLRYLEGWSLKNIAERMEKSEMAVAGLLKRGLKSLRVDLASLLSSSSH